MYRETVPSRQLSAWIGAALCPTAVQLAATTGWRWTLICGVLCWAAIGLVWKWGSYGRWVSIGAYILLVIFTGQIIKESATVWTGNSYPWIPLVLLALALWAALKGGSAAARVGCVLFWAVLIMYPVVFGAAIRDVDWQRSIKDGEINWQIPVLLLLPALGKVLLRKEQPYPFRMIIPICLAVIGTLLTVGMGCESLYEMIRSIDLFGAVKHFEAVVCAGATLGWFSVLSYCLSVCGGLGAGRPSVITAALVISAWMLCDVHIQYNILLILGAIFWVFLPLLTQVIDGEKNMKKSEISS